MDQEEKFNEMFKDVITKSTMDYTATNNPGEVLKMFKFITNVCRGMSCGATLDLLNGMTDIAIKQVKANPNIPEKQRQIALRSLVSCSSFTNALSELQANVEEVDAEMKKLAEELP